MSERRTSPVELLWDLVFVFAITQVSALLAKDLSWPGLGHALIVLALVWWAWSAFVWVANAEPADSLVLRGVLLTAMAFIFVTGLALPHAFGSQATLFAVTYVVVRFLHLGFYAYVSRRGNAEWSALVGFMLSTTVGMAMLVAGSFLDEGPRAIVWTAALALDYAGPAWFTRERLRGLQEVAVAHFAERYGLFVIICLGESIVAIGLSADRESLDAEVITAVALGLLATIGLWWTYFERVAGAAEAHLRTHRDPVLAAADGYSYIHLVIIAGIIVFAVGMKVTIHQLSEPLSDAARLATCGGVAAYLVGDAAFRLRVAGELDVAKLVAAAALLVLFAVGGGLSALWLTAATTLVLAALCTLETVSTARELEKEEA